MMTVHSGRSMEVSPTLEMITEAVRRDLELVEYH